MNENGSPTGKMISKNWVLKRKRRKLRGGPGSSSTKQEGHPSSESPRNKSSAEPPLTNSITSDPPPRKKKGDDGHYFDCMKCDLGGTLLCCEKCPQTYHIQCLNPPLKRIPRKKWLCPNCCQKSDTDEPKSDHDTFEKGARTKIGNATSKSGTGTSETEKASQIFGHSILGKKRPPAKVKSPISRRVQFVEKELDSSLLNESCSGKPSHISDGDCEEGSLLCFPNDNEKKPDLSSTSIFVEKKTSPSMEVLPSSKISNLEPSPDISNLEPSEAANEKNPDTFINNVASEEKSVPRLGSTSKKSKKRKRKLSSNANKKKSRTDKGSSVVTTGKKQRSQGKSKSSGPSKLHRIRKKVDCRSFTSLSEEDVENESSDVRRKVKKLPKKGTHSLRELNGADNMTNETVAHGNNGISELLQVDRVLGCRVQGHITNMHSDTLPNSEKRNTQSEEKSCLDKDKDDTASEAFCEEHQNTDTEKCIPDDTKGDNLHIFKKDMTSEFREGSAANSVGVGTTVTTAGDQDEESVPMDESDTKFEKIEIKDTEDISLKSSDIIEFPSICEEPQHATTDTQVAVEFEFLVKWVGKSHIHNNWISESQLKFLAKRKLENYKAKYGTTIINICEERWKQPQRVIAVRTSKDGTTEALVKWDSLPYDECTWERLDEPVIERSSHLVDLYHQFEQKTMERDDISREEIFSQKSGIISLTEQPKELRGGSLFPHQLEALNWLRKCWLKSKNVILADEMGLGKTVSASAFLSSLYHEFKAKRPCIVLVPLSTMPNWLSEFSLWAPDLNVVEYHGCAKARTMIRQYEWHASTKTASYKFNVLLTTYEMVIADSSQLRGIPWEVLIVDEGHRLKNSSSKLFSLLNTYSFQHRVLLTGTPLQNNIGEMYNLLNFLQPTSFPSLALFEEKFNDLTTAEKVDELKKLVAPHMLRRLKKDAMQNIPPKTERMVPVELSSIQAEYYRAMLTKNYQILRNIGKGVAQQSMLNIVMQLRKVCNHPYLIPGTEPEVGSIEFLHEMRIKASAKLSLLHSMLKELHREGHRVLIFSQMTKLLDILEDYLNVEFGPKTFERVDGSVSVSDRQAAISRFNQDKNRFVFLLSTRACGLGINLATADTVIIYDSDFNPHADIQAMNRAHRIGQSKRLLVYRLVVRASVEERILQLAKKKLMLDQLFVNKSGSQKEVEDILRWGTEELFKESSGKDTGENEEKKDDAITDLEHKHKRRVGGLGDVYTDKCTDGSNNIVWDETAIQKLLDRSDESGSSDIAEGEAEYDMLGSVKSLEWNDEQQEEPGVSESPPIVADDCAENPESKEGNLVSGAEENEWDRLLRMRWEKYQNEEEAVLGRGKRQRKTVSYREAFAPRPPETISESGNDEEREPELEPKKEYTPAGRALKAKYTMLRARQIERLANKNSAQGTYITNGLPSTNAQGGYKGAKPFHLVQKNDSGTSIDEKIFRQLLDVGKSKTVSPLKMGKKTKLRSQLDLSVRPLDLGHTSPGIYQASHHFQGTSCGNSATNNLLPVLGLCAPNASQQDPVQRKLSRSNGRQQSRLAVVSEFPFSQASSSRTCNAMKLKGQETDKGILSDTSPEALQQQLKDKIVESRLPFNLNRWSVTQEKKNEHSEYPGAKFSEFQEKMTLPNLSSNEKLNLGYTCPPDKNMSISHSEFFPSLSLGIGFGTASDTMPGLPTMPLLPNFKSPQQDMARYNNQQQGKEMPPMLGPNHMQPAFLSFPENHRKVLESIMMRTGSGSSSFFKRKAKVENWSEDELDCLWIGVRRHGLGNWEGMLRDPRLSFSKYKTSEDLSLRWDEEQLKIMDGSGHTLPNSNKRTKSTKSPLFPNVSDGMMARALHGSRYGAPLNFQQAHLTDMKLGFGDPPPNFPHTGQSDYNQHYARIPTLNTDRIRTEFFGDAFANASDRSGTSSNMPTEKSYLPNSFGTNYPGSVCMNYSGKIDLQQQEDEQGSSKYRKCPIPNLLDRSNNFSPDPRYNMKSGEAVNSESLSVPSRGINISHSKGKEVVAECTLSENKLPHWLRQAVSAPVKSPEPDLPPTVTAIAQSVRLLYGEEKPIIPPFVVPSPRPSQPIDPRLDLKKKKIRKLHVQGEKISSPLIPMAPPFHLPSQSMARIESDLNMQTIDSNMMMNLASSSANINPQKKSNSGMSPSPEVLQFVASSFLKTKLPLTNVVDEEGITNTNTPYENLKDNQMLPIDMPAQPPEEKTEQITESGDSSKTHSDPPRTENPDLDEVSSEGTVSDHPVSDHES